MLLFDSHVLTSKLISETDTFFPHAGTLSFVKFFSSKRCQYILMLDLFIGVVEMIGLLTILNENVLSSWLCCMFQILKACGWLPLLIKPWLCTTSLDLTRKSGSSKAAAMQSCNNNDNSMSTWMIYYWLLWLTALTCALMLCWGKNKIHQYLTLITAVLEYSTT